MASDVKIVATVDDKGTLKETAKGAHSLDRRLKGAAATSSNTTKNFSKMAQGMSGGLVPAYATLAANVFAITAAFRFLKDAADFRIMQQAQSEFARETGSNLAMLTRRLQDATDGQLKFEDASQAAAIGKAAGLSSKQMMGLANIAKKASIVLGRDLTDSFNRLTRGAIKAEPELLDELGIIVRLAEASERYARQIGKSASELTTFEKSQAVVNETLRKGREQFADLNVETNAFTKLAKTMDDAIKSIMTTVTPFAEWLANVLAKNIESTIALLGIFAAMLTKALIPQMPQAPIMPTRQAMGAQMAQGFTGAEGTKGRLLAGEYNKADIMRLKKSLATRNATHAGANKALLIEHGKTVRLMELQWEQYHAHQQKGLKGMRARWQMELIILQATHSATMAKIVLASRWAMIAMSGIFTWAAIAGAAFIAFDLIKNYLRDLGKTAQELKIREQNEEISKSYRDQAEAIHDLILTRKRHNTALKEAAVLSSMLNDLDMSSLKNFRAQAGTETRKIRTEGGHDRLESFIGFSPETMDTVKSTQLFLASMATEFKDNTPVAKKYTDELRNLGQILSERNVPALQAFLDMMRETNGEFDPAITKLKGFNAALKDMDSAWENLEKGAAGVLDKMEIGFLGTFVQTARKARDTIKELHESAVTAVGDGIPLVNLEEGEGLAFYNRMGKLIGEELMESIANEAAVWNKKTGKFDRKRVLLGDMDRDYTPEELRDANIAGEWAPGMTAGPGGKPVRGKGLQTAVAEALIKLNEEILQLYKDQYAAQDRMRELQYDLGTNLGRNLGEQLDKIQQTTDTKEQQITIAKNARNLQKAEYDKALKIGELTAERKLAQPIIMAALEQQVKSAENSHAIAVANQPFLENQLLIAERRRIVALDMLAIERATTLEIKRRKTEGGRLGTALGGAGQVGKMIGEQTRILDVQSKITASKDKETKLESALSHIRLDRFAGLASDKDVQTAEAALEGARHKTEELGLEMDQLKLKADPATKIMTSAFTNMDSALDSLIDGSKDFKEAFGDMTLGILKDISKLITKMTIVRLLLMAFPQLGAVPGINALAGLPTGNRGGYATKKGFRSFGSGGVVPGHGNRDTVPAMLTPGEVVTNPARGQFAGQNNNVVVNVSIDGNGNSSSQTAEQQGKQAALMGKLVSGAITEELMRQKRPGGILSPYGGAA